jgi:hypothetical protein
MDLNARIEELEDELYTVRAEVLAFHKLTPIALSQLLHQSKPDTFSSPIFIDLQFAGGVSFHQCRARKPGAQPTTRLKNTCTHDINTSHVILKRLVCCAILGRGMQGV